MLLISTIKFKIPLQVQGALTQLIREITNPPLPPQHPSFLSAILPLFVSLLLRSLAHIDLPDYILCAKSLQETIASNYFSQCLQATI